MFFVSNIRAGALGLSGVLGLSLLVNVALGAPVQLSPRTMTLPPDTNEPLLQDIDGDGRSDLLVLNPVEKKLLRYNQGLNGFGNSPDQSISLPPKTAWLAACDVDAHPGLEILFSTATGLVYSRGSAGKFESEQRTLIEAPQVFANFDSPTLTRLNTNSGSTNILVPVMSAGRTVLYHRDSSYQWSPHALPLDIKQTTWHLNATWPPWSAGRDWGRTLTVYNSFQAQPPSTNEEDRKNEAIRTISKDFASDTANGHSVTNQVDVNGDGRDDIVLWRMVGTIDVKSDIYVFLRGPDQKLSGRPSQVLHSRGFPIPIDSNFFPTAVKDLDRDGVCELVLLELKTRIMSVSGAVETALSHGLDWAITIRTFKKGAFSKSPDISFPVTGILSIGGLDEWPIFLSGDFNGDRRTDLFFRRSDTQWNIYTSTRDGRWFAPQPAITFEAPLQGRMEIEDVNGDGRTDILWRESDAQRLTFFMSPPPGAREKKP